MLIFVQFDMRHLFHRLVVIWNPTEVTNHYVFLLRTFDMHIYNLILSKYCLSNIKVNRTDILDHKKIKIKIKKYLFSNGSQARTVIEVNCAGFFL
jgi:hypothetical protein